MRGDKLPGKDQLDALARTFGVPAGALLSDLASTLDPARTKGEHDLLSAYRDLNTRQRGALLEVARRMAGHKATRKNPKGSHGRPSLPFRPHRGIRTKKTKRKTYQHHPDPPPP